MLTRRLAVVSVIVALVLAACGRSDAEQGSSHGSTSSTSSPSTPSQPTGSFGSLEDVCQHGEGGGATAQGVTPTRIEIGTFADPGFSGRPGLDQELFDAADVFSKWCNAAGGINGRTIVVDRHDSALTNVKARMTEACAKDFFLVGGGAVFDNDGVATRLQCLLPDIPGYVVTPEARGADLVVAPLPNPNGTLGIGDYRYLGKRFPSARAHVGILTGDVSTTILVGKQAEEAAKKLGWGIVYNDRYPAVGAASWAPYAQAMKDKGVEGLIWVGEPENLAKLESDMRDIGFAPRWIRADTNHYDRKLIDVGNGAVADTFIPSSFVPFEQASKSPALRQYLAAFARYAPGTNAKALLGAQAWSAWLLFARAAGACGADLTRRCVYDNAERIHEWTGGGLHAPTDPGANRGNGCFLLLEAGSRGFQILDVQANQGIYNCSPRNQMTLTGDYGKGVTLADVGKSLADVK
jgi:ABC-type branched-subunit amino acid transport system substrate-binding protein